MKVSRTSPGDNAEVVVNTAPTAILHSLEMNQRLSAFVYEAVSSL